MFNLLKLAQRLAVLQNRLPIAVAFASVKVFAAAVVVVVVEEEVVVVVEEVVVVVVVVVVVIVRVGYRTVGTRPG